MKVNYMRPAPYTVSRPPTKIVQGIVQGLTQITRISILKIRQLLVISR